MVDPLVPQAYKDSIGEIDYSGRGSLIYYFNRLYAGTEGFNAN